MRAVVINIFLQNVALINFKGLRHLIKGDAYSSKYNEFFFIF